MSDTPETNKFRTSLDGMREINQRDRLLIHARRLESERDELRSDLEFRRGLFELQEQQLNDVRKERDEWKQKFIQQNKDLGCEMMDPNGTIWDYAKNLQADIAGWETKWKCAVDMAAIAENERDEALAYADKLAAGLPEGMLPKDVEVLRDANLALAVERDALQEQLDAAIMLGKMQERKNERELEQVREQYRLSSVCRKLLLENQQLKECRDELDLEELIAAAKAVIDRWETPFWKEAAHTGLYIAALRKAVEIAEGGFASESMSQNQCRQSPTIDQ